MSIAYTLRDLVDKLAAECSVKLSGDPDCVVDHVAPLESADKGCIAFLASPRYREYLSSTKASAVIVSSEDAPACTVPALISENPYALYAKVSALIYADEFAAEPGIHPSASIHASAKVHPSAAIGASCVIEAQVTIGENCVVGSGSVIQKNSSLGANSVLVANVTICKGCHIGERALIHAGAVIGSDGFGFAPDKGRWLKIPQVGGVVVGDDVEIGANTTIDRGVNKNTVIEDGVKLDNMIQIAHNVRVGAHTAMAAKVGIAGSTIIGKHCTFGGGVSILGHLNIADRTHINSRSLVTSSLNEPGGSFSSGTPLEPSKAWRKNWVRFKQLDDMARRIKALEKQIEGNKHK